MTLGCRTGTMRRPPDQKILLLLLVSKDTFKCVLENTYTEIVGVIIKLPTEDIHINREINR